MRQLTTLTFENEKEHRSRELFNFFRSKPVSLALSRLLLELLAAVALTTSVAYAQTNPATVGQWTSVQQWPYIAGHSHLLPTGKVLFWPTYSLGDNPQLWDPATNSLTSVTHAGYDVFCTGHSFLADGKLFVTGGDNGSGYGIPNASIYDPTTGSWTSVGNMNAGRWYPTNTTLANGDVLVVSGKTETGATNTLPQVWQSATSTWRDLTSAQLTQDLYPRMFLAPNGKVAFVAPVTVSQYLDTSGSGTWSTLATENYGGRDYGNAVMYDPGKILLNGGGDPPTATAEVIDLNATSPSWRYVASMAYPRRQSNATLLPDGKVLVTGGSSGSGFDDYTHPVYPAEIWDPATETWTTVASISAYRGYHSTALLLPDGRVLSAGGEVAGATYEIYSPPYLFNGARPTITSAPTSVTYGQTFFVQTSDAASISQVTWIRLSSVTHAFNQNQRLLHLSFSQATGGLNVTSPANSNLSPPGDYMLFIVNSQGVPSIASMVRNSASASSPPVAPSNLTATAMSSSQINLSWTDNSNNETGFLVERSPDGTSFTQTATVGANITSYSDTGLSASTTFYYRVRASGSAGNSNYSNIASAITMNPPTLSLSSVALSPTSVIGGGSATGTVTLSGTAPSGGTMVTLLSSNKAVATVPASVTVGVGASSATFTITTSAVSVSTAVTISGTYNGGSKAATLTVNSIVTPAVAFVQQVTNSSTASTTIVATLNTNPAAGDTLILMSAGSLGVTSISGGGVATWTRGSSSCGEVCTSIWYGLNSSGTSAAVTVTYSGTANAGVNLSEFSGITALDIPGTATNNTVATVTTPTLAGSATTKLVLACAGINISGGATITAGPTNGFAGLTQVTEAGPGKHRLAPAYYVVSGSRSYSTGWTLSQPAGWETEILSLSASASSPPVAPSNLTATAMSSSQINLSWTDNSNNETGFLIERSPDGTSFTQTATVGANITSYSDTGLSASTTFYYRVRASGSPGNSNYSNIAKVRTKK